MSEARRKRRGKKLSEKPTQEQEIMRLFHNEAEIIMTLELNDSKLSEEEFAKVDHNKMLEDIFHKIMTHKDKKDELPVRYHNLYDLVNAE